MKSENFLTPVLVIPKLFILPLCISDEKNAEKKQINAERLQRILIRNATSCISAVTSLISKLLSVLAYSFRAAFKPPLRQESKASNKLIKADFAISFLIINLRSFKSSHLKHQALTFLTVSLHMYHNPIRRLK